MTDFDQYNENLIEWGDSGYELDNPVHLQTLMNDLAERGWLTQSSDAYDQPVYRIAPKPKPKLSKEEIKASLLKGFTEELDRLLDNLAPE